jgi:ribosomal protein S18 acetylase RimI-like enzyme
VIRHVAIDEATMRSLERHETVAHAIPGREMRDLGHAFVLFDHLDPEPFWNRMAGVRWPLDEAGFDVRMTEMLVLFAAHGRRPHVWPSPVHGTPGDLATRLAACGFSDIGAGHVMLLDRPALCGPVGPGEAGRGVTIHGVRTAADAGPDDLGDAGLVLAEAFGAPATRGPELADDLRRTLADPRIVIVLVRVDDEPAACAKATTFDGLTYLSSIGTRSRFRGRGLAALATRHAVAIGRRSPGAADGPGLVYLGVHCGNAAALRLYERLGFASVGESPDMLLE